MKMKMKMNMKMNMTSKEFGSGGIRTHASEETGALNQRLRPLGHATLIEICLGSKTWK